MENTALFWFKNDLRLHDNEALTQAIAGSSEVLPVYIFNPKNFEKLDLGFPKTDAIRLEFIKQCVQNLRECLMKLGGNLMICVGEPADIICNLVVKYNINAVYAEQEFATEELTDIGKVRIALPKDCRIKLIWGRTLYHLEDIPYSIEEIPLTSKVYRTHTTKNTNVRSTIDTISKISCMEIGSSEWGILPEPSELGLPPRKNYALTYLEGGETKALERLNHYLFETEQLTNYRWTRNRSLGLEYSSKFSPYLAIGCLSPRTIYEAVKRYEKEIKKNQSTWWLIFELVWRDYFTFKLMRFQNRVYTTEGFSKKVLAFENDKNLFRRWCDGRTGIPFVDAHMQQLNETGFMSNRGRVNCSSFLVHDYQVDWTWGAAYFESKLIDYDVASNWMNWHAQTYQTWYTNPVHQAHKYKAQDFIRKWVSELQDLNDLDVLLPWQANISGYPRPVEILKKWNKSITKISSDLA